MIVGACSTSLHSVEQAVPPKACGCISRIVWLFSLVLGLRVTAFPDLSAARLTREIRALGYAGAYTAVKRYLAAIRPENGPGHTGCPSRTRRGLQAQVGFVRFVVDFTDNPATIQRRCA